ncbi:SRPBCC family protein [Pseudomonas sp. NFR16]|uniref:SRPBCC family protein n=1 Tax=Pseudomonas sp. NFR16 TaxID=1566248 RepID=UPI0008AFB4BB|nr:SRPBCC family protein [Pseudomonas sp. NFR16]SEJ85508.1 Polyketide cyclase / dehydrase and lipid transport [Pseudomonas sp. NFR16]
MNAINTPSDLKPDTLINNPNGTPVISSVQVAAPAADVWKVVGDFGGFEKFIPALASISVIGEGVGSVRHKIFKEGGLEVVEQLNSRDDRAFSMTWTTIHNNLGVRHLWASMTVVPVADHSCKATWTIIAEPAEGNPASAAEFQSFLQGFADDAMGNVKKIFE